MNARPAFLFVLLHSVVLLSGATAAIPTRFLAELAGASDTRLAFTLPPGHQVVGHATGEGAFRLLLAPLDAHQPAASAGTSLEPTYECTNDERGGTFHPLTATPTGMVIPNLASRGECTGARGLVGPIHALYFTTSGDRGGGLELSAWPMNFFRIHCGPATTGLGLGADETWLTTLKFEPSSCHVDASGAPPSQYWEWTGTVRNDHVQHGSTRGIVVAQ